MTYDERAPQGDKSKIVNKPAVRPASLGGRLGGAKAARLVFFGTEDFSADSLAALAAQNWNITAVITKPDTLRGRGQKMSRPAVKAIAEFNEIPVHQPQNESQMATIIKGLRPTHGVLVAYGRLISKEVIELFPHGIINLHPSLLPKHRGPSPIETAILNGDERTGISLMKLSTGMDEGPVYAQEPLALNGREDRLSLGKDLSRRGAEFLVDKLPGIVEGELQPKPQDDSRASYTKLLKKEDGVISWDEAPEIIERKVRAFLGFPKTKVKIHGHEVVITKARVASSAEDGGLVIPSGSGWLEIVQLTTPGGRVASGADFSRGYKS